MGSELRSVYCRFYPESPAYGYKHCKCSAVLELWTIAFDTADIRSSIPYSMPPSYIFLRQPIHVRSSPTIPLKSVTSKSAAVPVSQYMY